MNVKWFDGLSSEEKEKRRKELLNYRNAFDLLKEVLEKHYLKEISLDTSLPGWEADIAMKHGERKAVLNILKLINIKD